MTMKELQQKTEAELTNHIAEKREELRKIIFGSAGSGMRNTRVMRNLRRDIAQAMTAFNLLTKKTTN